VTAEQQRPNDSLTRIPASSQSAGPEARRPGWHGV